MTVAASAPDAPRQPASAPAPSAAQPAPASAPGAPSAPGLREPAFGMAVGELLPKLREERGLTQQQLADRLYVTRQAVSRWERGETRPGIDMLKLIAAALDVPVTLLLEMPPEGAFCQSCGMYLTRDEDRAHAVDGTPSDEWCAWCVREDGSYAADCTMEEMIELCAPMMAQANDVAPDEAISLMGVVLPQLRRWREE